jgi:protein TonB
MERPVKKCPVCNTPYPDQQGTCPSDGSTLVVWAQRIGDKDPQNTADASAANRGLFAAVNDDVSQIEGRTRILIIGGVLLIAILGASHFLMRSMLISAPAGAESDSASAGPEIWLDANEAADLVIQKVPPVYPEAARAARIQGRVVLRGTISETGTLEEVHVVSGHPFLQQAAIDAVKAWSFRPYLLHGEPVKVEVTFMLDFLLHD